MNTPYNQAAWQNAAGAQLEVKDAPYTSPRARQIVVKNAAVAVNPADWLLQDHGAAFGLAFPMILGNDAAGTVVEVGSEVTRFKVGDRVLGHAMGCWLEQPTMGGFQLYTVLDHKLAVVMPDSLSFTDAAVIPLGLSTAACGLFQEDHLALNHPGLNVTPSGKTLLVWGGSSSVGCNAVQLAVAAGYEVFTTASPKNFDLVRSLGATQVFDYHSPSIVADLAAALDGVDSVGALLTIGSPADCYAVIDQTSGRKFVSSTIEVPEDKPAGVDAKQIFATTLKDNGVAEAVYEGFLQAALAAGKFRAAPAPHVVGHGISAVREALEVQKAGVSASKVVVTLG